MSQRTKSPDLRFLRLIAPSRRTVQQLIGYAFAFFFSWLFLHYEQGALLHDALLVAIGGAGVIGYQQMQKRTSLPKNSGVGSDTTAP